MIEIVEQVIKYFAAHGKAPEPSSLNGVNQDLLEKQGSVFVTLYSSGEVRGSAGNIKPIEENMLLELIASTTSAMSTDDRFEQISVQEAETLKARIDEVTAETILVHEKELINLEPKKYGAIAIKKDYDTMAVILPNISSTLHFWKDFPEALWKKMKKKFVFKDYIVYKLETTQVTNF